MIDITGDLYRNHKDIDLLLINESPSMIIGSLLIVVVWVRYMILARKPLDFSRALRHFILGFGIILTILLIAKINKISGFEALVICYFLSGLIMLTFFPQLLFCRKIKRKIPKNENKPISPQAVLWPFALAQRDKPMIINIVPIIKGPDHVMCNKVPTVQNGIEWLQGLFKL